MNTMIAIFGLWILLITGCGSGDSELLVQNDQTPVIVDSQPVMMPPDEFIEDPVVLSVITEVPVIDPEPPLSTVEVVQLQEPSVTVEYRIEQTWVIKENDVLPFPVIQAIGVIGFTDIGADRYVIYMDGIVIYESDTAGAFSIVYEEFGQLGVEIPGPFPEIIVEGISEGQIVRSQPAEWIEI